MDSGLPVTEQDAYDVGVHRIEKFIASFNKGKLVEPEEIIAKPTKRNLSSANVCVTTSNPKLCSVYRQLPAASVSQLQFEQQTQLGFSL